MLEPPTNPSELVGNLEAAAREHYERGHEVTARLLFAAAARIGQLETVVQRPQLVLHHPDDLEAAGMRVLERKADLVREIMAEMRAVPKPEETT